MPTLREALYTRLAAASVASGRIYYIKRPDNSLFPCVTYQGMSTQTDRLLDRQEEQKVTREFIIFDAWARNETDLQTVSSAILTSLENFAGTISGLEIFRILLDNENDSYDDVPEIFRRSIMFEIWYRRE